MNKPSFDNVEYVFSALWEAFYEGVDDNSTEEERDIADQKFDAAWSSFLVMAGWTHDEFSGACDAHQDEHVCDSCKNQEDNLTKVAVVSKKSVN